MDQAARPVILAASALLLASLVTLGVKAGGTDDGEPVAGDGSVAAGQDSDDGGSQAAPDTSTPDATAAPDTLDESEYTDPSLDERQDNLQANQDLFESRADDQADDEGEAAPDTSDDLDDMPETGGGLAAALGGALAIGGAMGLRRRR